jgi:hypothetical protein
MEESLIRRHFPFTISHQAAIFQRPVLLGQEW